MVVRIRRERGALLEKLNLYQIVLDGEVVGEIKCEEEAELPLPPGRHELYLKVDWCRSNCVEFESGEEWVDFECGSNAAVHTHPLIGIIYATLLRKKYLWLKKI